MLGALLVAPHLGPFTLTQHVLANAILANALCSIAAWRLLDQVRPEDLSPEARATTRTRGGSPGGSFDNFKQLVTAIRAFIDASNDRCRLFVWTRTPEEILPRATRQPTSDARH